MSAAALMNGVRFKDGVLPIGVLAPAGVRMLGVLDYLARHYAVDLTVTCADKEHAPDDPHSKGEAFDVRTHDLPPEQKTALMHELLITLSDNPMRDVPAPVPGINMPNLATFWFYAQIENLGQHNEHLHVQRRNGRVYA